EHSVQVLITEQGVADLRGKNPDERANLIINNCAGPEYKELLDKYYHTAKSGHTRQSLKSAFAFHKAFMKTGNMQDAKI
ncbi:MAG: acetyl-CoA hydrolase, partial [Verrucomicrobiae bacterium]|nr:acetyl-CoA hydrolase [Verrucomicrobiae bacterium]NNJ86502.1 acetyl-CoA hydrolase [Akkermansiaceae bacterium]